MKKPAAQPWAFSNLNLKSQIADLNSHRHPTRELQLQQQQRRTELRVAREQVLLRLGYFAVLRLLAEHVQFLPRGDGVLLLLWGHFDREVRIDAPRRARLLAVDAAAAGEVVVARRELQGCRALGEREEHLHAALAERALADDQRAVVVLQRAGDDLA